MDVEGFEEDALGALVAEVGDITVSIGVRGDNITLEQPGDGDETDIIMLNNVDQVEELIARLQTWVNSQENL